MRALVVTLLLSFVSHSVIAQKFDVDTIMLNGSIDTLINVVILGDGYTQSQLDKFVNDSHNVLDALVKEPPFSNYQNYFNAFLIKVPSNVSGAANSPQNLIDNYFGSTYNYAGTERLLVPMRTANVMNVLANNFPKYDQVVVIVNDVRYGGSGGWLLTLSTDPFSSEIFLHELGHSFAALEDEYWAGAQYAKEGINMTKETNLAKLRWKNWYGSFNIGLYPYLESPTWYRPHQSCKMRYLGYSFCAVCVEGIIERIHSLTPPLVSYNPVSKNITIDDYTLHFSLNLLKPNPNTLKISWNFNNSPAGSNDDVFVVNETDLIPGINRLSVTIEDTTKLIRVDNHNSIHLSIVDWNVEKMTTGIENLLVSSQKMDVSIFPNPVHDRLMIRFNKEQKGNLKVEIVDIMGITQVSQTLGLQEYCSLNLSSFREGNYILKLYSDNVLIATTKIIKL